MDIILEKDSFLPSVALGCLMRSIASHRVKLPKIEVFFFYSRSIKEAKSKPSQLSKLERNQVTWIPALPLFAGCFCAGRLLDFFFLSGLIKLLTHLLSKKQKALF